MWYSIRIINNSLRYYTKIKEKEFIMKKKLMFILLMVLSLSIFMGCNGEGTEAEKESTKMDKDVQTNEEVSSDEEIPTIRFGYMFSNHQAPLIIAAAKGEDFSEDNGIYLKEVLEKEEYVLMDGETEVANVSLIVGDNGGELMTLMNQDRLDMAFGSVGLPLTNIDQGSEMKVLSPIHVDGIGLVMLPDAEPNNFETFATYVEESEEPVVVGYHSPQNAPVILFTTAMEEFGYTTTEDVTDTESDILLVNLKGTGNLIPSLQNGEVDAFIGPSPFPELADVQESGKIVFDLKDLPPEGRWENFPCCVMIASGSALESYPVEIESLFDVISYAADFANVEKDEAAEIVSEWMGVDLEAARRTGTKYTTNPTETWDANFEVTYDNLQEDGKFEGQLEGVSLAEVHDLVFDLDMAQEYHDN